MKVDLSNLGKMIGTSCYFTSLIEIAKCQIIVIGADEVIHSLIKERFEAATDFSLTPTFVASLYKMIPGQYALLFLELDRTTIVSDPYGIIKIYYIHGESKTTISDSLNDFRGQRVTLDGEALKYYFVTGYTPSKHTFFREIKKVEPCSMISWSSKREITTKCYGEFGLAKAHGPAFLKKFQIAIVSVLDFVKSKYRGFEIALTGGIDSSFLLMLMNSRQMIEDTNLSAFRTAGLEQSSKIDNDYDLQFADRLAKLFSKNLSVVDYDFREGRVAEDFNRLIDTMGCDYCPAMGFLGYYESVEDKVAIINGQNADSILSFGGMGWPRFQGMKLTGLNGFFTRYFQFYGASRNGTFLSSISKVLRSLYYRKSFPNIEYEFTRQNYFKGLGINPENRYYSSADPAYEKIANPDGLASWFESEYIEPMQRDYPHLSDHALSVVLYSKTYMQGSANRGAVLSALTQKKSIYLPYSSLEVLELMTNLIPDWKYAFYGKYPNIGLGIKKLSLPKFILNRVDPSDSDSSVLLSAALAKNQEFNKLILSILERTNFSRYNGILTEKCMDEIQAQIDCIPLDKLSFLMKFVWVETVIQQFIVDEANEKR